MSFRISYAKEAASLFPDKVDADGKLLVAKVETATNSRSAAGLLAESELTRTLNILKGKNEMALVAENRPDQIVAVLGSVPLETINDSQAVTIGDTLLKLIQGSRSSTANEAWIARSNLVEKAILDYASQAGFVSDTARAYIVDKLTEAHKILDQASVPNQPAKNDLRDSSRGIYGNLLGKIFSSSGDVLRIKILNDVFDTNTVSSLFDPESFAYGMHGLLKEGPAADEVVTLLTSNPDAPLARAAINFAYPLISKQDVLEKLALVVVKSSDKEISDIVRKFRQGSFAVASLNRQERFTPSQYGLEILARADANTGKSYDAMIKIYGESLVNKIFSERSDGGKVLASESLAARGFTAVDGDLAIELGGQRIEGYKVKGACPAIFDLMEFMNIDESVKKQAAKTLLPKVELEGDNIKITGDKGKEVLFDFETGCFKEDFLDDAMLFVYAVRNSDLSDEIKERFEKSLFPKTEHSSDERLEIQLPAASGRTSRLRINNNTKIAEFTSGPRHSGEAEEARSHSEALALINLMRTCKYKDPQFFLEVFRNTFNIKEIADGGFSVSRPGCYKFNPASTNVYPNTGLMSPVNKDIFYPEEAIVPLVTYLSINPKYQDGKILKELLTNLQFDLKPKAA